MIYVENRTRGAGIRTRHVRATLGSLLAALNEGASSVSVTFVRDLEMRALNRAHRGKDRTTDVLSFSLVEGESPPQQGERMLGDIVISVDAARRQAADYGAPVEREVERLLIHGVLHLLGYDHQRARERTRMVAAERRLARTIGMPWVYEPGQAGLP